MCGVLGTCAIARGQSPHDGSNPGANSTVFVCALALLGRSPKSFPTVQFIEKAPAGVSPRAEAYAQFVENRIVLITSTSAFRRARRTRDGCADIEAIRDIAGVVAHEEWHLRHGPEEEGAYHAQLIALTYVGAGPDTPLYQTVVRSMQAVSKASRRAAEASVLARSEPRSRR
jgi:hypothetical protein